MGVGGAAKFPWNNVFVTKHLETPPPRLRAQFVRTEQLIRILWAAAPPSVVLRLYLNTQFVSVPPCAPAPKSCPQLLFLGFYLNTQFVSVPPCAPAPNSSPQL